MKRTLIWLTTISTLRRSTNSQGYITIFEFTSIALYFSSISIAIKSCISNLSIRDHFIHRSRNDERRDPDAVPVNTATSSSSCFILAAFVGS
jgi:hypothetical protein